MAGAADCAAEPWRRRLDDLARKSKENIMSETRSQISHLVRVARVRIETAVVEIEGGDIDDEEAERQAIEGAEFLPSEVWTVQPFDANAYRPHVQSMLSHDEFA